MIIMCTHLLVIVLLDESSECPELGDDRDSAFPLTSVRRFSAYAGDATLTVDRMRNR